MCLVPKQELFLSSMNHVTCKPFKTFERLNNQFGFRNLRKITYFMYWVMGRKSLHANLQKIQKVNKLSLRSLIDNLPFDITRVTNMVGMLNYFEVSSNELE